MTNTAMVPGNIDQCNKRRRCVDCAGKCLARVTNLFTHGTNKFHAGKRERNLDQKFS